LADLKGIYVPQVAFLVVKTANGRPVGETNKQEDEAGERAEGHLGPKAQLLAVALRGRLSPDRLGR